MSEPVRFSKVPGGDSSWKCDRCQKPVRWMGRVDGRLLAVCGTHKKRIEKRIEKAHG